MCQRKGFDLDLVEKTFDRKPGAWHGVQEDKSSNQYIEKIKYETYA